MANPMNRADLTEKILDIKREKGWSWKHITAEIGGMSPVLVVGALLGQMKLVKPLARAAAELFGAWIGVLFNASTESIKYCGVCTATG